MFSSSTISQSMIAAVTDILNEDREYVAIHKPSGKVSFVGKTKQSRDGFIAKYGSVHEPSKVANGSKKVGDTWI
jgi:hypothetical protein